jgi:hypothetical protein
LLAFALLALSAPAVLAVADETEHVSKTLKMDPGGTLRLKNFSGRVTITASDRAEVVIDAVRRASRERLARITLDIHTEGANVVVVDANHRERSWFEFSGNNVVETDLDITVPRQSNLDVAVFSSPVTIEGVEGSHNVHSFSARLSLNDVTGPIKAHTFSGTVVIREKSWGIQPDHRRRHLQRERRALRARERPRQRLLQFLQRPPQLGDAAHPPQLRPAVPPGRPRRWRQRPAPLQNLQRQRQDRPLMTDTIGVARYGLHLL